MRLQRIRIEQFRKFASQVEINGLEPGLNVLHGPNEAGKSTIAQAIRTLFFEKHNTKGELFVSAISPASVTSAAPSIEIDFTLGELACKASKTFLQKPRGSLTIAGDSWDGSEADEKLAETLGFVLSGKGVSRADTHGIPGLLWVEQGSSTVLDDVVTHASGSLEQRLKSVLGEITSTSGTRLLAAILAELGKLRTATGRSSGVLAETERMHTEAVQQRDALGESAEQYRTLSDRLTRLIADRDRLERDRPWEGYERGKRESEAQKAVLEPQLNALEASRRNLRDLNTRIEGLHEQIKSHDRDLRALVEQRTKLADNSQAHQQASDDLKIAEQCKITAREALIAARANHKAADQQQRRISLEVELTRIGADIRRVEGVLAKAGGFTSSIAEQRTQAAATKLTKADLAKLEKLEQRRRDNRIQREAVATRIAYRLEKGRCIEAGELGSMEGEGSRHITAPVTLHIDGVGDLDISPGGEDIERLSTEERELGDAAAALCAKLGVADLVEAQDRHTRFQQLERDIALAEKQRDTLLDDDAEEGWREKLAEAQGRSADVERQLAALPVAEGVMSIEAAQRALDDAEVESRGAEENFDARQGVANKAEVERGALNASIESESRRLEGDAAVQSANKRQLAFDEAVVDKKTLEQEIGVKEASLAELNPALIDADIKRYAQALTQIQNERRQLLDAISADRATLETLGADGLDEKLAAAEEEAKRQDRRLGQYRLRADALSLLVKRLAAHQEAATQRLYAPLRDKLQHYLKILFPGTTLAIGIDKLRPTALARNGAELTLDAYSHGTREQLGVIARLAYADLLKEAGQPTLLILDDALVHSDADRRQQMKRIIHDASQRHQILLFTCHAEDWRDAGARTMTDVSNLRAGN